MARTSPETLAAIDCGTNSTRLLVVDPTGQALTREIRITRLGQGVDATGKLDPEAISRTVTALEEFRRTMDLFDVARARVVATSAARDASNSDEFLRAATEAIGVETELLSGAEEGRLAYTGAAAELPEAEGDDVVVDIGGGSTELVMSGDDGVEVASLKLGCVRLTERHLLHDPPLEDEMVAAELTIERELDRAQTSITRLNYLRPNSRLIGLAGTVSTLVTLEVGLTRYDRDVVHHSVLSRATVGRWCRLLAAEPASERGKRPGMLDGRQDVIVAGALVLRQVMTRFGFESCLVSESDMLDGLVASLQVL